MYIRLTWLIRKGAAETSDSSAAGDTGSTDYISYGLCIGMCLGTALGASNVVPLST